MLDAIQAGLVPPGEIPPSRRALLLEDRDPAIRGVPKPCSRARSPGPRIRGDRPVQDLRSIGPAIPSAADRSSTASAWPATSSASGATRSGPNLASVRRKTPEEILVSILDPNREVSPEFVEYLIALDDGRVVTGLVAAETPSGLTLRGREGAEQTILRRNVAEIASTGKSLMPEGLEKNSHTAGR